MSEKRFIVESVMIDCLCEDEPRIAKVITDTKETYSYEDLDEIVDVLNEQQAITEAKDSLLSILSKENEELRRLFEEMKQPRTINLTEEDEKELRKLLGLIDDE